MTTTSTAVQSYRPGLHDLSFKERCQVAVNAIKETMMQVEVTTLGESYGKDSSAMLVLVFEAARQILAETGASPRILLITSDTLVENPLQVGLTKTMSARALQFADENGLEAEQVWVTPENIDHYLVSLIGGRGVASMPGSSATCSIQLKILPMDRIRRKLSKQYGAENIAVMTGVRHDESTVRSKRMNERGESGINAVRMATGSLQLAPIADWDEADVWRLLNASKKVTGIETLDFEPTVILYEMMGDSTCGTVSLAETAKKAKSPCKGGRGGCFLCQKVDRDHSMENIIDKVPGLEPLLRLSRTIRAGHFVPENRTFLSKAVDEKNRIRVFSNAYSPTWCSSLLKWVLSIDADEDLRVAKAKDKYAKAKNSGASEAALRKMEKKAARQWPRLLTDEQLFLIAFQWSRYGVQKPGEFPRIHEAVLQGQRWELPTDDELANLEARADKSLMGKTFGYLQSDFFNPGEGTYRDHFRDMLGEESACAPSVMIDERGERAIYRSANGKVHDTVALGESIDADLSGFTSDIELSDFFWWYAMEFADGTKSHNAELNFLVREGIIVAKNGYQSQLAEYQRFNHHLHHIRQQGPVETLDQILTHPCFVTKEDADRALSASCPRLIATDSGRYSASVNKPEAEQMELFVA